MKPIDISKLNEALLLLNEQLILTDAPETELVVCGGSALIATGLVPRTTQDVDVVALMKAEVLVDPEPLPDYLLNAAGNVCQILKLPTDWLNNGPAAQFQLGLPPGFQERLTTVVVGKLVLHCNSSAGSTATYITIGGRNCKVQLAIGATNGHTVNRFTGVNCNGIGNL